VSGRELVDRLRARAEEFRRLDAHVDGAKLIEEILVDLEPFVNGAGGRARVAESVDAGDSKSPGLWPYEFESRPEYSSQLKRFTASGVINPMPCFSRV
jgi:hypothetical protein